MCAFRAAHDKNLKSRIVSLAWVVADFDPESAPRCAKTTLVKPGSVKPDYDITEKATRVHKITNARAMAEGQSLPDILQEFMQDVRTAYESGGRIAAHHLDFDASVIKKELERCGFTDLRDRWVTMVKQGFCTMDPPTCKWVMFSHGEQMKDDNEAMPLVSLVDMVKVIAPHRLDLINNNHEALADAQMARLLYIGYIDLARKAKCFTEEEKQ